MEKQSFKNHRKFYTPHHFILLPALLILEIWGIINYFQDEGNSLIWLLFSIVIFVQLYLAVMLRQHYALGNQNRIIRLEFKQRYFELFSKRSDDVEEQLTFAQIAALRFAYDEEFKQLLDQTLQNNLSANDIKKSITQWRSDLNRI